MSDNTSRIAAMLADRKNTRLALATALVERNAQLDAARDAYRALRAAAEPARTKRPAPQPVVTRFTKADGSVWEKTRTGNTAVIRQVTA